MFTSEGPRGVVEQTISKDEQRALYEAARKVLLFYIGVFALAMEEIEALVDRMIERGEIGEQDGRNLLREVLEKRREATHKVKNGGSRQVESVQGRMVLPTRADIAALDEQITRLSEQIEGLSKGEKNGREL